MPVEEEKDQPCDNRDGQEKNDGNGEVTAGLFFFLGPEGRSDPRGAPDAEEEPDGEGNGPNGHDGRDCGHAVLSFITADHDGIDDRIQGKDQGRAKAHEKMAEEGLDHTSGG